MKHRFKLLKAEPWIYWFECRNCGEIVKTNKFLFRLRACGPYPVDGRFEWSTSHYPENPCQQL